MPLLHGTPSTEKESKIKNGYWPVFCDFAICNFSYLIFSVKSMLPYYLMRGMLLLTLVYYIHAKPQLKSFMKYHALHQERNETKKSLFDSILQMISTKSTDKHEFAKKQITDDQWIGDTAFTVGQAQYILSEHQIRRERQGASDMKYLVCMFMYYL